MKLNVGCGTDYREGYVNIDGSQELNRVDKVVDIARERLTDFFDDGTVDFILANDIIEHQHHWEALSIFRDFYCILAPGGKVEIRVPDTEYIVKSWRIPLERKILLLYGGQDIPQGNDAEMDQSRKLFPEYFCHRYGWTRKSMSTALREVGFENVTTRRAGTNFVATADKGSSA